MVSLMSHAISFFISFYLEFTTKRFIEEWTLYPLKLFQKIAEDGKLSNSFYGAAITLILKPNKDATKKENYMPISLNILVT